MTTQLLDSTSLTAIVPLTAAGFAVHWLHAKSKRPYGNDWSEKPVASLEDLRRRHQPGDNTGVRLGEPSSTSAGYLHVFDLDIRLPDLADEAWAEFARLLPGVDRATMPTVASGSGGESRHVYFVTDKPFFGRKIAVSEGKHRRETHDPETGEVKIVWSYDWEIELFGTGKQVAMPPSIHPDTGQPYTWEREFDFDLMELGIGPSISSAVIESLGVATTETYAFEAREPLTFKPGQLETELDLIPATRMDDRDDWITLGQALHHQFGGSEEGFELWMKHSARGDKFLVGSSRAKELRRYRGFGRNRRQPVTMASIRLWVQEARAAAYSDAFDDLDDDCDEEDTDLGDPAEDMLGGDYDDPNDDPLSDGYVSKADKLEEAAAKANGTSIEWEQLLDRTDEGAVKPTLHNVEMIVRNDPRLVGLAQLNEFTQETVQRTIPGTKGRRRKNAVKETRQLTGRVWQVKDTLNGELWSDDRDFAIRSILEAPRTQGGYAVKVSDRDLKAAVVLAANSNAFHPVREYLSSTTWDGTPRIDRLWIDYVNAPDDVYHRTVARLVMVAAVTRIFEPGHKFDFATILEGMQGKRKSTLISVLGRSWFAELNGDFHDTKSMVELMQGSWIMEIPELTGFGRADVRAIKAFISTQKDRVRLAYARRAGQFPRQCIFIGSTNDREYLKDDTGGRRFWPVECRLEGDGEIDTERLDKAADQMWAEAVVVYQQMRAAQPFGTLPLYLADPEARAIAARLQESRRMESPDDVMAGKIGEWLEKPYSNGGFDEDETNRGSVRNETCSAQIWVECLQGDPRAFKTTEQSMVNRAMQRVPGWASDGSQRRFDVYGKQRVFYRGGVAGKLERMGLGDLL